MHGAAARPALPARPLQLVSERVLAGLTDLRGAERARRVELGAGQRDGGLTK